MEEDKTNTLLQTNKSSETSVFEQTIELKSFKSGLPTWVFLDHSTLLTTSLSWSLFFLLTIVVPLVSHFMFSCSNCDVMHQRPYDGIVQLSLSILATLSFVSLYSFTKKYGLRKFLFLDKMYDESQKVRDGYAQQIQRSMKILSFFVLPCFIADAAYKIWWFATSGNQIPYYYNVYLSNTFICILLMSSWLYRTSIFFLVCVLFRLICYLQILIMEDFARVFEREYDVASILIEHLRIRRHLRIISHRFRRFILFTLILVTGSQFISLLVTLKSGSIINLSTAGEISLCSITLVAGLFICLRTAARITHKAQSVTSLSAKWHACATINNFDGLEDETPPAQITSSEPNFAANWDTDNEEGDGDDALDNTNMLPFSRTISYQKRQALVKYFEHNRAGITVYGFTFDRTLLHWIFAVHLSLTLWILNKTIGIS
ncbi:hypothetical protein Leryth_024894 [Lithospermum erythrorhizon]|nr:hypothetical protein Leryth_024894 [Lithospermum erythrorhizon]